MKILFIFGTRPEAIKLVPLIRIFKNDSSFITKVCVTAQHRQMLDQVLDFFEITPDYDLNMMRADQTLFDITATGLKLLEPILDNFHADIIFVQGDTTTAFIGALAGYYKKIRVGHVEAGLRSGDMYSPFPEEGNRKLVSHLTSYHFAPTLGASKNLYQEGKNEGIYQVGNTVIDALFLGLKIIKEKGEDSFRQKFDDINLNKKILLVTGHRRESFGEPFLNICHAIRDVAQKFKNELEIIYPVHLNPNVRRPVNEILTGLGNVHLIEPLNYPYLIWLMSKCHLVLTDSGGIQEEAPSLGKPVLVMRDVTERMEGVEAGTAKLVGTGREKIVNEVSALMTDQAIYDSMSKAVNPYGDGKTSERIIKIIKNE